MKKNILIMLSAFSLFVIVGCVNPNPQTGGADITIPMEQVNSSIKNQFPQEKKTDYGTVKVENPNLLSKAGSNKVGVGTDFTFKNALMPNGLKGAVSLSSGLKYNPTDKGVYLDNPTVEDIKFQNFALSKYLTGNTKAVISQAIAQTLIKKPIYNVSKMGVASSFVKSVNVKDGNLVVNTGL